MLMAGIWNCICCGGYPPYTAGTAPKCIGIPSCPELMKPYGVAIGIAGKAIGGVGNMPGMLCMGCMPRPGAKACIGVPPGPIMVYGTPCKSYRLSMTSRILRPVPYTSICVNRFICAYI